MAVKVLAINENGELTYCSAPPELRGKGRCNHVVHQEANEDFESFGTRVENIMLRLNNKVLVNLKPSIEVLKNEKLLLEGVQDKWFVNNCFVKADLDEELNGELRQERNALSEELVSHFLKATNLEFASYKCVALFEKDGEEDSGLIAASSENFLGKNEDLVSFSSLLTEEQCAEMENGETNDYSPQFNSLRSYIKAKTNFDVGPYLLKVMSLDLLIMNPDRHLGNLALIKNKDTGEWRPSPIFDNGQSLLASKTFDNLGIEDSWSYEEHQTPITFGLGPVDDYFDLINNNITAKDAIRINFSQAKQLIESYENPFYENKFVKRSKDLLIQRLEDYEGILWINVK